MVDKNNPKNLEEKASYRILKVLYGIGWIAVFIITGLAFLILKPTGYIDLYNSTVTCSDGNKYQLNSLKGFYKVGQNLNSEDQLIAHNICTMKIIHTIRNEKTGEVRQVPESQFADYGLDSKKDINYSLNFKEQGSWSQALLWTAAVLAVGIFLLNFFRDIILYITIGKKFSYWWLISNKSSEG